MNLFYPEIAAIGFSIAVLFLLSMVEGALIEASAVTLRMSLEHEAGKIPPLLPLVIENKTHLFLPLHLGIQLALMCMAILITLVSIQTWPVWGAACAFGLSLGTSLLFRQLLPRLMTQNESEKKLVFFLRYFSPLISLLRILAVPLSEVLGLFKRLYQETDAPDDIAGNEPNDGEIQAYLEIGEDEGILEREDAQLIQSVVEFGDTLVREVMTPRTRIAACNENATVGELRNVMVESRHSRIPIYRGDLDHIVGIAYIRYLLAHYSQAGESQSISSLVHPAFFVPETKRVSALLKDLQMRGDHAAIVIDEFGGVAGLVTIEDLVEEIVGEIRDEDEAKVSEIVEESPGNYLCGGGAEIDHLEEVIGKKIPNRDAATVAGLVAAQLGRIPAPGEEFDYEGMRIQIRDADRKRIRRVRIRIPHHES